MNRFDLGIQKLARMKHLLLVWFMAVSIAAIGQQNPILEPPKVDQRVELMSIVFRLADSREYSSQRFQ